ncbi:MAG: amino acid adenylation domain-containing protein, partial [Acidobacteria bacterium]|nr:amino acid adenylation domain-containing protein [Acidobacteriota bacterium]
STLYMVLLSALKVLLHRYTGQGDLCVGTPIANRQYVETEGLIGMFVNTLAMRTLVDGSDSFVDVLAKVKTTCLEAYERQDAPFEKVVQALNVRRNLVTTPLFQVMAVLQNMDMGMNEGSGQIAYSLGGGVSKFDLTVFFTEAPDGLEGILDYKTSLYKAETAARMAGNFVALCEAIVSAPAAAIGTLDYLSDAEKQSLLVRNNDTAVDYPKDRCVHDLFVERAALVGENLAVVCGEERLTYRQLEARSRDLALVLQAQGVTADSLVGVCMERSLEMVVSLLAILRAGGAYVPLDPEYPDERLSYMLQDSGAAMVLTQQALRDRVTALSASAKVQAVDAQWPEIEFCAKELRAQNVALETRATPKDLAYVIYTSGSTGRPKGVMVEHQSVVNYVTYAVDQYVGTGEDACASFIHFPLTFDASVTSLFAPLLAGKAIDIDRKEAVETFKDGKFLSRGYDFVKLTPAHLLLLRSHSADLPKRFFEKKNVLVVGGEALTRDCVDFLGEVGARVEIINEYGPTEATVGCTTFRFAAGDPLPFGEDVSIGKPIANTQIYVLDAYGHPQPAGVPGELYIAGDCLARGYLHRDDLTQERFVPNPFVPGTRMYKTGDLARWREDGNLQYLGRIDTQVKIRGFRIELGEIEARLNQHPLVLDNAVVAQGSGADRQLVAFYRAASVVPQDELRAHLQQALPEYMLPAASMRLEAIPLTTNGKVDRRALERMKVTIASSADYVAPRNDTERRLVAIWAEVLNRPAELIGVHDDFFDLGGHSLSAVQLMAKASRQFRQMLPLAILFTAPDVASLAKLIASDQELASDILVPIQPHGDAQPVFAVPGAGGNVLSLQPLSRTLGDQQPFFALQAVGLDGKTPPHRSVEATAEANIAALKTVQPSGPYQLVGHSYGGVVAYEMARMLLERGEEISSLTLVDSLAPSVMRGNRVHDEVSDLVEAFRAIADRNESQFELDVEALRELSFNEVIAEMADLLSECGVEIDAEQIATFYRVYRANVLCYDAYMPSLLPRTIDVSLYRATQGRAERNLPHDYGWGELLQSPLNAADVHADHFSILTEMSMQEMS